MTLGSFVFPVVRRAVNQIQLTDKISLGIIMRRETLINVIVPIVQWWQYKLYYLYNTEIHYWPTLIYISLNYKSYKISNN